MADFCTFLLYMFNICLIYIIHCLYFYRLVRVCNCYDPELPYDSTTPVFSSITAASGPCRLANSTNGMLVLHVT